MPYETIDVRKLTPAIGAEISGVDLGNPLSNRQASELHDALMAHQVIFFRDQHMSVEQHKAFGRLFGDLHLHPAAPHEPGKPELMIIHADKDSPRANGEGWHSDVSCDPEPPMGSILYIRQCPARGGDTLFANMYAAYDALSDRMKAYLDGLTARHNGEHYRGQYANYGIKDKESYPFADHPIVRTVLQFVCFFLKSYFWVFVAIWLRWTLPRIRVDQMMIMCWKYLVPIAFMNLLGTAVWMVVIALSSSCCAAATFPNIA